MTMALCSLNTLLSNYFFLNVSRVLTIKQFLYEVFVENVQEMQGLPLSCNYLRIESFTFGLDQIDTMARHSSKRQDYLNVMHAIFSVPHPHHITDCISFKLIQLSMIGKGRGSGKTDDTHVSRHL